MDDQELYEEYSKNAFRPWVDEEMDEFLRGHDPPDSESDAFNTGDNLNPSQWEPLE